MSILSYKDLFDFDEYEARLNKLAAAHAAFAQSVARGLAPINEAYAQSITELGKLQKANEKINVSANGAKEALIGISKAADEQIPRVKAQREVIDLLNGSIKVNEQSVKDLKDGLKKLKSDYEALNPAAADFSDKQKQVKAAVQAATDQINAQLNAVKAAKKSVDAATGSYAHLSRQTNELRASLRQMDGAFDLATGKINKHNKEAVEMQRQIQKNDAALKRMDAGMGNYQRNVGNYSSALKGLGGNLLLAGGAAIGISSAFDAISESIKVIDRMQKLDYALRAVSDSSKQFSDRQIFVRSLANQTGQEIEGLTRSYVQFTASTRNTSLEGERGNKVFAAFSKSFAALGASSATAERGLNAVQQMVSKGVVSSEELRQQLSEALPGSTKIFADALGVTTAKLGDMLKKGEVLSADVLPKVAAELEKVYGEKAQKNLTTISGSWANLTNQVKYFLSSLNDTGAISGFFAKINNGLASMLGNMQILRNPLSGALGGIDVESVLKATGMQGQTAYTAQMSNFKGSSLKEQVDIIKTQTTIARTALREFNNFVSTPYNHDKRKELRDYAQEQYKILNTFKEINRVTAKQVESEKPEDKEKKKKVLTQYEKLLATVEKLRDTLVDETLADVKAGRKLELPEYTLKKWNELYAILEKTANLTGTTIPKNIEELNEKLNPLPKDFAKTIKITQGTGLPKPPKPAKDDFGKDLTDLVTKKLPELEAAQQAEKRLLIEKTTTGSLRKINEQYKTDLKRILDEIHEFERQGNNEELQAKRQEHAEVLRMAREELAVRKEIAEQSIQVGGQAVEALFEIRSSYRQQELEANQKAMENELAIAGDNLSAQSKIKADFAQKDLELRRQQAKADKAQALFSIAINTAVAIVKLLDKPALAILAGITGGIQAATVLAKPLPAFWTGTDNAPQGLATVAERGPEIRESKGRMYYYERPQVAYLERGDVIYDAADTRALVNQAMRQEEVNNILQRQTTGRATVQTVQAGQLEQMRIIQPPFDYNRMSDAFVRAIESRPQYGQILTEEGLKAFFKNKSGMTVFHDTRYSLGK